MIKIKLLNRLDQIFRIDVKEYLIVLVQIFTMGEINAREQITNGTVVIQTSFQ